MDAFEHTLRSTDSGGVPPHPMPPEMISMDHLSGGPSCSMLPIEATVSDGLSTHSMPPATASMNNTLEAAMFDEVSTQLMSPAAATMANPAEATFFSEVPAHSTSAPIDYAPEADISIGEPASLVPPSKVSVNQPLQATDSDESTVVSRFVSQRLEEARKKLGTQTTTIRGREGLPLHLLTAEYPCDTQLFKDIKKSFLKKGSMPPHNQLLLLTILSKDKEVSPDFKPASEGSKNKIKELCHLIQQHLKKEPQDVETLRLCTYKTRLDPTARLWFETISQPVMSNRPLARARPVPQSHRPASVVRRAQRAPGASPCPARHQHPRAALRQMTLQHYPHQMDFSGLSFTDQLGIQPPLLLPPQLAPYATIPGNFLDTSFSVQPDSTPPMLQMAQPSTSWVLASAFPPEECVPVGLQDTLLAAPDTGLAAPNTLPHAPAGLQQDPNPQTLVSQPLPEPALEPPSMALQNGLGENEMKIWAELINLDEMK